MSSRSPLGPDSSRMFIVAACIVVGVVVTVAATPKLLLHMPTELSRTTETIRALRNAPSNLAVVVTGDSVTMNGINAKLLGEELTPKVEAWNVGSPGQELTESLFIADMLPRNVHTLVVGLLPSGFCDPTLKMPEDRYLFYRISGYKPSAEALEIARKLPEPGLYEMMSEPEWKARLSGRGMIRVSADLSIRAHIRHDLDFERGRTDLYFPAVYKQRISEDALTHAVKLLYQPRSRFQPTPIRLQFLTSLRDMLARRGQRLVLVVLPEHPRSIAMTSSLYYRQLAEYENKLRTQHGFDVIDVHDRLAEPDFVDQIHPFGAGSERLTKLISASLLTPRTNS